MFERVRVRFRFFGRVSVFGGLGLREVLGVFVGLG